MSAPRNGRARAGFTLIELMVALVAGSFVISGAYYLSDVGAAVLGLVWIGGRAAYYLGYTRAVPGRLPGFFIQSSVCLLLVIGAIVGMAMRFWGE